MTARHDRRQSYLAKLTAEFLNQRAGPRSLITVTDFELTDAGRSATVWLAVWPESAGPAALSFVRRQISDWKNFVQSRTRFRPLPRLTFYLAAQKENGKSG